MFRYLRPRTRRGPRGGFCRGTTRATSSATAFTTRALTRPTGSGPATGAHGGSFSSPDCTAKEPGYYNNGRACGALTGPTSHFTTHACAGPYNRTTSPTLSWTPTRGVLTGGGGAEAIGGVRRAMGRRYSTGGGWTRSSPGPTGGSARGRLRLIHYAVHRRGSMDFARAQWTSARYVHGRAVLRGVRAGLRGPKIVLSYDGRVGTRSRNGSWRARYEATCPRPTSKIGCRGSTSGGDGHCTYKGGLFRARTQPNAGAFLSSLLFLRPTVSEALTARPIGVAGAIPLLSPPPDTPAPSASG